MRSVAALQAICGISFETRFPARGWKPTRIEVVNAIATVVASFEIRFPARGWKRPIAIAANRGVHIDNILLKYASPCGDGNLAALKAMIPLMYFAFEIRFPEREWKLFEI